MRRSEPKTSVHSSKGQVGGDQDGAPLVALAEDLQEQFRPGGGQGHESQLVDDQQAEAGGYTAIPLRIPTLLQLVATPVTTLLSSCISSRLTSQSLVLCRSMQSL